jgi:hypothetical protein
MRLSAVSNCGWICSAMLRSWAMVYTPSGIPANDQRSIIVLCSPVHQCYLACFVRKEGTSGMMPAVIYDNLRNELYAPAHLLSADPRFEVMISLLLPPQTQSLRLDSPSLVGHGHKRANDNLILIDSEDLKSRHNQNQVVTKSKTTFSDYRKHSSVCKLYSYAQV